MTVSAGRGERFRVPGDDVFVAEPGSAELAAVRACSPLAAELRIEAGPFTVPASVVAAVPTLEQEQSEPAEVLREFLALDPWRGMGSVYPGGWMLLARDSDTMVFGQREGPVGLGKVVTMARRDGRFTHQTMGGWALRPPTPGEQVIPGFNAQVQDTTLTLEWVCGRVPPGVADRQHARTELLEGPDDVHMLLISEPTPAERTYGPAHRARTLGGMLATATVELQAPLGRRRLFNDFRIPAVPTDVHPM